MFFEIFSSILSHKVRSLLTGFGIAWGIFILIILVGVGKGFEEGVLKLFSGFSKSTMYIICGETSKPFLGLSANRKVFFSELDLKELKIDIPEIKQFSPEASKSTLILQGNKMGYFDLKGVYSDYFKIKLLEESDGRLIDESDNTENRKVAFIGKNVAESLFPKNNPIGKLINIDGDFFKVIGIIKSNLLNSFELRSIYIPYSTFSNKYLSEDRISISILSMEENTDPQKVQLRIKSFMGRKYGFSSSDDKTFFFNTLEDQVKAFNLFFNALRKFLWFMGLSTLISGVIGVGNIMYVVAKERTKEIGIRKAVGAKSKSIMIMMIGESIILTSTAGYLGILVGWLTLKIINHFIQGSKENILIGNAGLDIKIILMATLILVISGTVAGVVPSRYAANLNPVDALRQE